MRDLGDHSRRSVQIVPAESRCAVPTLRVAVGRRTALGSAVGVLFAAGPTPHAAAVEDDVVALGTVRVKPGVQEPAQER